MKSLIASYQGLSSKAQDIVSSSADYQREAGEWFYASPSIFNLGESIRGIAYDNGIDLGTRGASIAKASQSLPSPIIALLLQINFSR